MNAKQYVREIIERSCLPRAEGKRIKKDLESEIFSAEERGESIEQIIERMGDPDEVAAGLYENFGSDPVRPFREYKSKKTLFGLPLVHIISRNYSNIRDAGTRRANIGRYSGYLPTAHGVFAFGPKAKGIVAVGNFSAGIISIGNLSTGVISIGNLSAGLFSVGNIALALLVSIGNAAAGALSAGNAVLGYGAAGNAALGKFAVGNEVAGTFTFSISNLSGQLGQVKAFFAGLDAPAWVKAFFGVVEKVLEAPDNPITVIPFIVTSSAALLAIILTLVMVPNRLLKMPAEKQK